MQRRYRQNGHSDRHLQHDRGPHVLEDALQRDKSPDVRKCLYVLQIFGDRLVPNAVISVRGCQEDKGAKDANGQEGMPILVYILVHGEMDPQK